MFVCIYTPPKKGSQYFLENLPLITDHYSSIYDNHIILGDFNTKPKNPKWIIHSSNLYNSIKPNTVVKLNWESKTQYFHDIKISKSSKALWDKCKPYFSNKHAHDDSKNIFIEKENIITNKDEVVQNETLLVNNDEIAKTLNNHCSETVEKLNTFKWPAF